MWDKYSIKQSLLLTLTSRPDQLCTDDRRSCGKQVNEVAIAKIVTVSQGLPFTPFCSDKLGRRATLFIGSLLMLGGVAMQSTANTVGRFVGARVLSALIFNLSETPSLSRT